MPDSVSEIGVDGFSLPTEKPGTEKNIIIFRSLDTGNVLFFVDDTEEPETLEDGALGLLQRYNLETIYLNNVSYDYMDWFSDHFPDAEIIVEDLPESDCK